MSVIYYDTALKEKIKGVFDNTFFAPTDEAFRECAKVNYGKVKLPMISFYRPDGFTINWSRYNHEEFLKGYPVKQVKDHPKGKQRGIKALPVRLNYQLDIWSATKRDCDRLSEEIILFLKYYPMIEFVNPRIELYRHDAEAEGEQIPKKFEVALHIEETVQDNSDIASFGDRGRYYRNTLQIYFEEPRLFYYFDITNFADEIPINYLDLNETNYEEDEDLVTHNEDGGD